MTKKEFNDRFGEVHWKTADEVLYAILGGAQVVYLGAYDLNFDQFSLRFPDGERLATVELQVN